MPHENEKHKSQADEGANAEQAQSSDLTAIDETYRNLKLPLATVAALSWNDNKNWSTHKAETFKDTDENGEFPAWGLKSIIDRGVQTHEKSKGANHIEQGENQVQRRKNAGKKFKSYSMVDAFYWDC